VPITISNVLLLLLRPDQQDYQGTAVTVDVARKLQVEKLLIAVNKAPDVFDFDELKAKVEATYRTTVAGIIPHSDDLMILASSGIFSLNYPEHPVTRMLEGIAEALIQ
jgi:MinD-like ATPase involved in chromosome partitioning or flagellar assembly